MSLSLARKRRINGDLQHNGSMPSKRQLCDGNKDLQESGENGVEHQNENGVEDSLRCGKILRMHLTNFMCHSNLSVEFDPRVNFLVGSNGSGKSAVLAALVLGLGGNAKTTNRSRTAKAFIKTGEQAAKIEIVIANDGPQPYEPETYGDKIIVVRTIAMNTGSYVLKNAYGDVVSKKLDDLHRLLMYHNVQVDNPVFVLNQDSAREFLKDLEPSKNYNLFLKATQIDTVMEKLNDSLHLHRAQMLELKSYKIKLEVEAKDINDHKEKLRELLSFEKLKDILQGLQLQHDWMLVRECEDKLQEINDKIQKYEEMENELRNSMKNKDKLTVQLTEGIKENESVMGTKSNDYDVMNKNYRIINGKMDELSRKYTDIQAAYESLKKKKSRLEKQIEEIKQFIDVRSKGNQAEVDAQREDDQRLIANYRAQCEAQVDPMIENLRRELKVQIDSKSQKEQVINGIRRRQKECADEIRLKNGQIATAKASVQDKLLIYGNHIPELLKEIQKANSRGLFSKLPRGPVGNYLEVPKSAYRDAIEHILGYGLLTAFLVDNTKDRQVLEQILKKFSPRLPIIITSAFSNTVYNVNHGSVQPPNGTHLVMHEILCLDPVVLNCLIDRMHIESILLTNNKKVAEQITSVYQNVPKNLSKVIALKEGDMALEYFPMPKYRMYSSILKRANFIQVNVKERIRHLEKEKLVLENNSQSLETDLKQLGQQIPHDLKLIHEKRRDLDKQETSKKELLEKISELEGTEYADYSNETNMLKREMDNTTERLTDVENKLREKSAELSDAEDAKQQFEQELATKTNDMQKLQREIETYQIIVDQLKMKLRGINNNDSSNSIKLKELAEVIAKLRHNEDEITQQIEDYTAAALEKGAQIDTDLSPYEIKEQISKIQGKLKHGKPVNIDPQTLREYIKVKEEALKASQGYFDNIKSSIFSLRKSLKFRFDFIKTLKEHMALLLQLSFSMILKLRNFEGFLNVNHQSKTLSISVIPRDHKKNAVSSTKSLSGGERSYSTVAFLISLWSCVDHPFYFLDEYDVFTDEVNREYMTRLLVDEGRKRPLRQYTFLTPQDMDLMSEKFIKILRLGEPDNS